jgi:hypothetical protein|tara:strand:- start:3323 stop:3532 length:210 start_codon:yes stop_codon:yes gene_type:complete
MAYAHENSRGITYYLHSRVTNLRGGRQQRIYFFAKDVRDDAIDAVPDGYIVSENTRTGLPLLKKDRKEA